MTAVLAHRGPDHHATWVEGPAGLGHRRLSILDLSPRAHQPMSSSDGRLVIVFNGEIYNFREVRKELEAAGDRFVSDGDTEIVLGAFRRSGVECFRRLNGMFAVAIWDRELRELTIARDRFGQKPLYFRRNRHGIAFGSEIKAILALPGASPQVDREALHEYCYFGNALGERTLFEGIRKLQTGHWLRLNTGGVESRPFWRIEDVAPVQDEIGLATSRVSSLLESAVTSHLVSDVPVGVFLSGGIDSSAITMLAAKQLGSQLSSYSVAFDSEGGELSNAREVALLAGSNHHEVRIHGADIADAVRALVRHHDQPFGDAANLPLYLLAKELGGTIKVVLQGDGGDEVFAGYRRYNVLAFQRVWRALSRTRLINWLPRGKLKQRASRFMRAAGEPDPARMMALLLTEEAESPPPTRLLSADVRGELGSNPFARYAQLGARLAGLAPVQKMLHTDCSIILPDIFNEKVDRATMAFGLEVRLPFLDNDLTQYVLGLPWQYKVHRLQKKWLLRRALRGVVPDSILDTPKRGFGVPYGPWLRGPLREMLEEALFGTAARSSGLFDAASCRKAVNEHVTGSQNHGFLLYKMLQLSLWYEAYVGSNRS